MHRNLIITMTINIECHKYELKIMIPTIIMKTGKDKLERKQKLMVEKGKEIKRERGKMHMCIYLSE